MRYTPYGCVRSDQQLGSWLSNLVHKVTGTKTGAQKDAETQFVNDAVAQLSQPAVTPATGSISNLLPGLDSNMLLYGGLGLAAILLLKKKSRR